MMIAIRPVVDADPRKRWVERNRKWFRNCKYFVVIRFSGGLEALGSEDIHRRLVCGRTLTWCKVRVRSESLKVQQLSEK